MDEAVEDGIDLSTVCFEGGWGSGGRGGGGGGGIEVREEEKRVGNKSGGVADEGRVEVGVEAAVAVGVVICGC